MRQARLRGQVFGPGFPGSGAPLEFEASERGLALETPHIDDGRPAWREIEVRRTGWDGAQLRLEWQGRAGRYSLHAAGREAAEAVRALCGSAPARSKPGGATRTWVHAVVWLVFVLPLVALGALAWQHERIAEWAVSQVPVEAERKLGALAFAQHRTGLRMVEGRALAWTRDLGARLARGSRHSYEFHLAEDDAVNAFALPGGFVVVNTGLLRFAESPEEVAGVLAHEIAHVERRHGLRALAKSLGVAAALSLVLGDTGGLASIAGDLVQLKFSRDHETEADRAGLDLLVAAGVRPQAMSAFFGRMATDGPSVPALVSTHPPSAERMAALEARIRALPREALEQPLLEDGFDEARRAIAAPRP